MCPWAARADFKDFEITVEREIDHFFGARQFQEISSKWAPGLPDAILKILKLRSKEKSTTFWMPANLKKSRNVIIPYNIIWHHVPSYDIIDHMIIASFIERSLLV